MFEYKDPTALQAPLGGEIIPTPQEGTGKAAGVLLCVSPTLAVVNLEYCPVLLPPTCSPRMYIATFAFALELFTLTPFKSSLTGVSMILLGALRMPNKLRFSTGLLVVEQAVFGTITPAQMWTVL